MTVAILLTISGEIWSRFPILSATSDRISEGSEMSKRGRLRGIQMGEDQRDGLRMFVVDEFGELLRVDFLQNVEVGIFAAERLREAVDHLLADFGAERLVQHFLGVVEAAAHDKIVRHVHLIKLFEKNFGMVRRNGVELGDLAADQLHFVLGELFDDLGARLVAEQDQQHGGFADAGQRVGGGSGAALAIMLCASSRLRRSSVRSTLVAFVESLWIESRGCA